MYRWQKTDLARAALTLVLMAVMSGCASQHAAREGATAADQRDWDAAVYFYLEALADEPDSIEYRMALVRARQKAAQQHFQRGMALRAVGQVKAARDEMLMAVQLDPTHQFAAQELSKLNEELQILSRPDGAASLEEMKRLAREAKVQPPLLDPTSKDPITLNFPKPKPIKEIYQAIGKAYGFNALFDSKLKDDKLTIELANVTAEQALELVMKAGNHFYKVIDPQTIIIAEDTPQNRRDYEDLVIKTFFLSNADVKEVDKLLRSLIEARRLATNEQLNAITLRDTADKVAIAERLISINDKAKAEVLIDVELLQINTREDRNIGMSLSTYSFNLSLDTELIDPDAPANSLPLPSLGDITTDAVFVNIPSVVINLVKSAGQAQTLAQPQLRITEGEKASLVIGDRVPIPVTSFNTSSTVGGNVVPITSFQYQDVGIKVDVEPRVHHNREVTLKLQVEVSQLGDEVTVGPGQTAVTIGTRNINSVIRLQDGESSLLAGLFRSDTSDSQSKVPFLGDLPIVGRLFSNKSTQNRTTDLVLTLTPHIVRFPDIQEEDLAPVWVGTESRISFFGSSPRVQSGSQVEGPFDRSGSVPPQGLEEVPADEVEPVQRPIQRQPRTAPRPIAPFPSGGQSGGARQLPGTVGGAKDIETAPAPQDGGDRDEPVAVSLEPGLITLQAGETVTLRVLARVGEGSLRLPIGLSYDPSRVRLEAVEPLPGVESLTHASDAATGRLSLDAVVGPSPGDEAVPIALLRLTGISAGPVPIVFTGGSATAADGRTMQVLAADAAVVVLER